MGTRFSAFMKELKKEAEFEGPEALAELRHFRERLRLARRPTRGRSDGERLSGAHVSSLPAAARPVAGKRRTGEMEMSPVVATPRGVAPVRISKHPRGPPMGRDGQR